MGHSSLETATGRHVDAEGDAVPQTVFLLFLSCCSTLFLGRAELGVDQRRIEKQRESHTGLTHSGPILCILATPVCRCSSNPEQLPHLKTCLEVQLEDCNVPKTVPNLV